MNAEQDPNFYINGAKRMVAEGKEAVSKIIAFMKQNEEKLRDMSPEDRKKFVLEFEPSKSFNQVHPFVFQYLAVEGIFNANAFKRYVISVYGKPKTQEEMDKARLDKKYTYYYKNAKAALYYKYLLIETNPTVDKNKIHKLYEEAVSELNKNTDHMFEVYKEAEEQTKILDAKYSKEKRMELAEILKKQI